MSTVESLLSQLEQAASTTDLSLRHRLSEQLQRLARSIATPRQTMQHFGYTYTEQAVARAATDLDLFAILAQSEGPLSTEDIARKSGGDLVLIGLRKRGFIRFLYQSLLDRLLRHLASTYAVTEVGVSSFAANETTRLLASLAGKGNIMFGFNILNKAFQALPDFLKETGYNNTEETLNTAFHRANNTKMQFFLFMQQDKEVIRYFHPSLTAFKSPAAWTAVVPLAEKLQDADKNAPLFVDVGGGHGYQCAAFRKATAGRFSGRVINQDLPPTLAEAPEYEDIEMMVQDFYQKQQIQGAKIYYIRQCLHDLPDDSARQVLQNIRDAMSPQSFLLIDELVIPDTGASRFAMQLDITMMAMFNSPERTVPHWRRLLGEVGLEITQIYKYDPELEYSILEAVPVKG